jgi:hypothetical protein
MDTATLTLEIADFAKHVTEYAAVLAAVGTVTMALLELAKGVFDARMRFNNWRLGKWIPEDSYPGARAELYRLATGHVETAARRRAIHGYVTGEIDHSDVVYDQPLEKMMGLIQAASNMTLDFPQVYQALYRFLVGAHAGEELSKDAQLWLEYATSVANSQTIDPDKARNATQARARIGNLTARRLDGFQNESQYLWSELNQRVAVGSAALFLLYLLWPAAGASPAAWLNVAVLSFFGGLVAPFAKDVVSALSGLSAKAR